jgi:hypothetical protein
MTASITRDEWLQALHELQGGDLVIDPDVLTLAQLTQLWGCGRSTTRDRVIKMIDQGRAVKLLIRGPRGQTIAAFKLIKP